ncbi:hypothetical protein [Clostridium estertheticum]|nr:hypothetical protein [Clostridium estertheticum]
MILIANKKEILVITDSKNVISEKFRLCSSFFISIIPSFTILRSD